MYNARWVNDNGKTFSFGYENGTIFDIDPLSGIDVDLATSQGYMQVGESVLYQSVAGISRSIRGTIIGKNAETIANNMINALHTMASGRLYVGDKYCDCYVEKSPTVQKNSRGVFSFIISVFCAYPYWKDKDGVSVYMNKMDKNVMFRQAKDIILYPTTGKRYFTQVADNNTIVISNESEVAETYTMSLYADGVPIVFGDASDVYNPASPYVSSLTAIRFEHMDGTKAVQFNAGLAAGDTLVIGKKNGVMSAVLKRGFNEYDVFHRIDDTSNLLDIPVGENSYRLSVINTYVDPIEYDTEVVKNIRGIISIEKSSAGVIV